MKKLLKALATLAAVAMLGTSFIGCASDDDGGKPADTVPTVNWPASPTGSAGLAASLKNGLATMDAGSVTMNGTSYSSIADALAVCTAAEDYEIVLTAGKYEELLSYSGPGRVVIKGTGTAERGQDVVIFGNNSSAVNANGGQRSIFYYKGSGSLTFENLSILNTYERPGKADAQAECIQAKGTGNVAAYKCSFMSHQDTIQTVAKAWFYDCYVEGDVDFIWMEAGSKVALYENCTLVSLGDETDRAYIAAPKIDSGKAPFKGLVVLNSVVKANNPDTTLCRNPWNSSSNNGVMYNQVAYINTTPDLTGTGKVTGLAISGNDMVSLLSIIKEQKRTVSEFNRF